MSQRKRNPAKTRNAILQAARHLFAQRDISAVSIRDIAEAAGVSHGLVQQYFGTREQMIAAIIQNEIEEFGRRFAPIPAEDAEEALEGVRSTLMAGRARFHDYAVLITRAQLTGIQPETMLDPAMPTPAAGLAAMIRDLQAKAPTNAVKMDPRLVSAYINAVLFAFESLSPWLMTSVGLKPRDYEARHGEIVDITMKLIAMAIGVSPSPPDRPKRQKGK